MGITLYETVAEVVFTHRRRHHRMDTLNAMETVIDDLRAKGLNGAADIVYWKGKEDRFKTTFSTKETWEVTREAKPRTDWCKGVWFPHHTPKYSFVTWLAVRNRLSTGDRMVCWNAGVDPSCVFCKASVETRNHLFFDCPYAAEVWSGLTRKLLSQRFSTNWETIIKLIIDKSLGKDCLFLVRYTFQLTVHSIWKERNGRRHGEAPLPSSHLTRTLDKQTRNRISSIHGLAGDRRYTGCMAVWFGSR